MRITEGGATTADYAYHLIGATRTFRVNSDGSTTPVIVVTARSQKYDVVYTWTMLASTWDSDEGGPAVSLKTEQVNAICDWPHVQDFRTETDQGASQVLYNFAVITVGTEDEAITNDLRVRMDHLNASSVFTQIDALWAQIAKVISA